MDLFGVILWASLAVILVIVEISTVQFVAIWFAVASLVSFVAALLGVPIYFSCVIFILVSIVALLATRPLVKKFLSKKAVPTNADVIIGLVGVVREKIDNLNSTGRILVNGLDWSARSEDDDVTFSPESRCVVVRIEGVKAIVRPQ